MEVGDGQQWVKLHDDELHNCYSSCNIVSITKKVEADKWNSFLFRREGLWSNRVRYDKDFRYECMMESFRRSMFLTRPYILRYKLCLL